MKCLKPLLAGSALVFSSSVFASPFTASSPSGLDVTSVGASTIGGIVAHFVGVNGTHVVSQLAASALFKGFGYNNPLTIGTQTGFDSSVSDAWGGGLSSAAFRFTLYDGDTAAGDFDEDDNWLLVNGINLGNWSDVNAQQTDSSGTGGSMSGGGFRDNSLDTGWFYANDVTTMTNLYNSILASEGLTYALNDATPGNNYLDFTRGIDNTLVNVGSGPINVPGGSVPEPMSILLLGIGLAGMRLLRRKA